MSKELATRLEKDGYDSVTAQSMVKMANEKPDEEARDFLSAIIDEPSTINRYISKRVRPRSSSPAAKNLPAASRSKELHGISKKGSNQPYGLPLPGFQAQAQAQAKADVQPPSKPKRVNFTTQDKVDSIKDLDAAIRKLEVSGERQPCTCMGSRHGLLDLAPNCLHCGRIVCNKEGIGPCFTCKEPLVDTKTVDQIYSVLHEHRGDIASTMGRKALEAAGLDPSIKVESSELSNRANQAKNNLEKLLGFQDTGASRTRIIDQVADFETPDQGVSLWATPKEQAEQLHRQQRQLRYQQELRKARNGRGKKVVSVEIRDGKVVQHVQDVIEPEEPEIEEEDATPKPADDSGSDVPVSSYFDPGSFTEKLIDPKYPKTKDQNLDQMPNEEMAVTYDEDQALLY